ncbi:integrase catalytic domain-containing protein [Trichonephila clavipes]|nr:integrase catalytic domain-containing protein [Trichonephila clavipes]
MTDPVSLPSDRVKDATVFEVVGVDLVGPLYVKRAVWWGGFYERLVRTVKELLRRTLGKIIFTYEELLTIVAFSGVRND